MRKRFVLLAALVASLVIVALVITPADANDDRLRPEADIDFTLV